MYRYLKLLLVAFVMGSSSVLIGMDGETKEMALERIRSSGYIAKLTDLVDDDMIFGNYAIDRIQTDLANKKKMWIFTHGQLHRF